MMGMDKKKARKHQWRIPERNLFAAAIVGGSIGVFLGMRVWRHKTKTNSFVFGIPLIIFVQFLMFIQLLKQAHGWTSMF